MRTHFVQLTGLLVILVTASSLHIRSTLAQPIVGTLKPAHVTIVTNDQTVGTYKPKTITVRVGQRIAFTNKSNAVHTVTSDKSGVFDSRDIRIGKKWTFTAKRAGTFTYHCTYHPDMHGKIVVKR